jgi:hypothetical protein|tara:strand:+ start:2263 stop:2448 length:186 start_codon:yes stop_codon:yes gene_type:complete
MTSEKTPQAIADDKRRKNQFSVRLDPDTAAKLQHFMWSRNYSANEALKIIVSRFFKGHTNA